ncbi:MAG TPA: tRNA (N(6)-L-threonylcarbamoyladenosine(37)-C(2))-methylthiotransferase MtaB [Gemmataceae bacterium]|nr:tRNA (N(6)-L-threonylcarbamoyladenosine(37)-C(2))-methylthiotransferase MtaB [Gemmataceae bacterium]
MILLRSSSPTRTCRLATLGCKVNQYETQYVKETLEINGYREAADSEPADLCVVNTCTVTMEGDAKSRQLIRRLHQTNPAAAIVVMGCYATRDPDAVAKIPGVTQVITDKQRLAQELKPFGVERLPRGIRRFDGHQRAFVKVQDGCILNCTYCIIPTVRPGLRSRPAEEIVEEVTNLVAAGRQEIVLTGIHLGHYGIDLSKGQAKSNWCRLWNLVEQLDCLDGDFRIRLSSLEAAEARDDLVSTLARSRRVVPHLHLCLQSGSDRILERMRRRYRRAGFVERCRRIRQALDLPALTTDVIVGFPGETDADFEATCDVVREAGFNKVHVFSWSPRRGTPAAEFADRVAPDVIARRREHLQALAAEMAAAYHRQLLGRQLDVLVEGADVRRPGNVVGTSCRYAMVSFPAHAQALLGRRAPVRIIESSRDGLIGEPVPYDNADLPGPSHIHTGRLPLTLVG